MVTEPTLQHSETQILEIYSSGCLNVSWNKQSDDHAFLEKTVLFICTQTSRCGRHRCSMINIYSSYFSGNVRDTSNGKPHKIDPLDTFLSALSVESEFLDKISEKIHLDELVAEFFESSPECVDGQ